MFMAKKSTKKASKASEKKRADASKKSAAVVKKALSSSKKKVQKEVKRNNEQDKEIAKLREEIDNFKKKKQPAKHVSEYNLFIRKQIRSGLTFIQAVKEWNKYKKLEATDKRRPSAYNQFIGSQMRLGKTFTQAVALWKLAKAGKLGRKGSTKTVTKTVVRTRTIKSKPTIKYRTRTITSKPKIKYRTRTITSKPTIKYRTRTIKSKPEIKYRTRTKTVVKTVTSKPKIKYRTRTIKEKPKVIVKKVKSKPKVVTKIKYKVKKVPVKETKTKVVNNEIDYSKLKDIFSSAWSSTVSKREVSQSVGADDEEIAFKIVQTYFKEIARFGFKKQLTLDEIINSYIYALAKVKHLDSLSAAEAVRRSGITK